jgi:hypothetical protein
MVSFPLLMAFGKKTAVGAWRCDGTAKRNEVGYPSQGGNPLWFQLPNDSIWTIEILQMVDKNKSYRRQILKI